MKLIIAIVNNDDAHFVNTGLTSEGFHITKVSSTGGFLLNGNSTFFIGTEDDRVERALEIIRVHSKKRVKTFRPRCRSVRRERSAPPTPM